ncbi:expressed unknown protein [Seminavis robusta]|uniref:J domain-containing protein n=1 Tax=Seminavis robusta TaxID=568900 RepID=A0A9N8EKJ5_9STRA|nr:expressed unknown protein [Seminavis robusta]|eukprot:Sro1230_g254560.1 n/a (425) ;mRNA; f:24080-25354
MSKRRTNLKLMGFGRNENPSPTELKKRYKRLALSLHPDKGGVKEDFQAMVHAYEWLCDHSCVGPTTGSSANRSSSSTTSQPEEDGEEEHDREESDHEYTYAEHYSYWQDFFHHSSDHQRSDRENQNDDNDDYFETTFDGWHERARQRARQRRQDIKDKYDWRDTKFKKRLQPPASPKNVMTTTQQGEESYTNGACMFCGVNYGIQPSVAEEWGLNWAQYVRHSSQYRTCWACLKDHTSVLTKKMAMKKFARKLDPATMLENGQSYPAPDFFRMLQRQHKTFHYQPVVKNEEGEMICTRNSEYYWYPDLEAEALRRGWKPRGSTKFEVPWQRKDRTLSLAIIPVVTPQKKKQRKKRQGSFAKNEEKRGARRALQLQDEASGDTTGSEDKTGGENDGIVGKHDKVSGEESSHVGRGDWRSSCALDY